MPEAPRVLFFVRGRGSGHAIPDLAIAHELRKLRPDVQIAFASYGTGAKTLAEHQVPLVDLQLPEGGDFAEMLVRAGKTIARLTPDLVVAHEETGALAPAKIFNKTAVYVADFFTDPMTVGMHQLIHADKVLFLGKPGVFEEPPSAAGRVEYVGTVLRNFEYGREDHPRARRELGFDEADTVIAVLPGSWTEAMAPIADLVVPAFDAADLPSKRLIWLAGADQPALAQTFAGRDDIRILERDWQIDRIFTACDLAITKANRKTVLELDAMGVPSIALSPAKNPIDDRIVSSLPTVVHLERSETTVERLAGLIEERAAATVNPAPAEELQGGPRAAQALALLLSPPT